MQMTVDEWVETFQWNPAREWAYITALSPWQPKPSQS
jgi:hypothetical protein